MTCNPFGASLFTDFYNGNDAAAAMRVVADRVSDSFVDHSPVFGATADKTGFADSVAFINTAFKQKYNVLRMIEEGNTVVAIWDADVTHVGRFLHLEATGRSFHLEGITVYEIKDGLITAHWEKFDVLTILTSLGVIPPLGI